MPRPGAQFRFVDLFAGIGGFHVALDELGGECVFASETDGDARSVYERNFDLEAAGDIRPLTEAGAAATAVPPHDVLCAGFPCQPFSKSGFQRGINETRGTLFFNILKVLEAHRPRFAILENVRNLAGPRQRETWETIIRNLRRLGYRIADEPAVFSPHLLPPDLEGRPQVRERVFMLAELVGEDAPPELLRGEVLAEPRPVAGWDPDRWRIEEYLDAHASPADLEKYSMRPHESCWTQAWDDFVKSIDADTLPGFPIWVDAFVPEPRFDMSTPSWKRNFLVKNSAFYLEHRKAIDRWLRRHDVMSFPLSRRKFEWQARKWQPTAAERDLWQLVLQFRPSGIRAKPPTYLPALVAITQTSVIGSKRRRITPREAARLQGFPDGFHLHDDDAAAYKQLGNAVNVGAVKHVARRLFDASPAGWPGASVSLNGSDPADRDDRGARLRLAEGREDHAPAGV